jgi:two-component system response regulator HydG
MSPANTRSTAGAQGGTTQPAVHSTTNQPHFAGTSAAHSTAIEIAERYANFDHVTVLIEGESGTGKSYVARHVHLSSPRARGPFHQVILSALDDNLAASDLFGHLSGSYTDARQNRPGHFVTANGGTLLLDEIGKASPGVQRKLLHAIEHQEIWPVGADRSVRLNVRLVAASNIPLSTLVERGTFLDDLAARLTNFRVRLPSLRERREDIPPLVRQFVASRAPMCGYPAFVPRVDDKLMLLLQEAAWPYNLRQLDGAVQCLLIEANGAKVIMMKHCNEQLRLMLGDANYDESTLTPALVQERMLELKSIHLTARSFGVSRWTIYRYLERAEPTKFRAS